MGEEISTIRFCEEDRRRFAERLGEETDLLERFVGERRFSEDGFTLGFELEACLLDHNGYPANLNERLLRQLDDPDVVPELSRFNVEFNCTPRPATGQALRLAERDLAGLWRRCNGVAHRLDANIVMIGTLPTVRESDLTLAAISPMKRYHALNSAVLRQRHGRPLHIDIAGVEHLVMDHGDVMLESATTSFQIHLKAPQALAHRYLNASMMVSGPVLAACGNSPFVFGRTLWEETRIPLFEQSVALAGDESVQRVTFGSGYHASVHECLRENLERYPVLLPIHFDETPERFRHLRLHNGTIWRWNRPLVGFEADGRPHFRIEHRVLPAGPSFADMLANAALYLGLVHQLVNSGMDLRDDLPFEAARANFYAAARGGLKARLAWPGMTDTSGVRADELLRTTLIPAARAGLAAVGIASGDADYYLDIMTARVRSGNTGSAWQRGALQACGGDVLKMMSTYCEHQRSGAPVHEWTY